MLISQPTKHMKNSPQKPKPVSRKSFVPPSNLYLYLCLPRAVKSATDCHTPGDLIPSTSDESSLRVRKCGTYYKTNAADFSTMP
jgi:hypothetical protein